MSASSVNERNISIATEVQVIAKEINRSPSQDQLKRLDEKSKIQLGFPHEFIAKAAKIFLYENTFSLIDNHRAGIL